MRVYLVRHACHSLLGRVLCGRAIDVGLNAEGCREAGALADYFADQHVDVLQSSPQRRALETAQAIAARISCEIQITPAFDEHDAGEWAGREFTALARDPRWRAWNERRGATRPPRGESMSELQQRVVDHIEELRAGEIDNAVIVSHAEPIRAAVMHYRGIALDDFPRVEIEPASITLLQMTPGDVGVSTIGIMEPA
jgi:broad specificity phosphatase PhoE